MPFSLINNSITSHWFFAFKSPNTAVITPPSEIELSDLITRTRVEFSQLAADYKTVNLGQGFPDFSPPKFVQDAFCKAICGGPAMHQYTRAFVRESIAFSSDVKTTFCLL